MPENVQEVQKRSAALRCFPRSESYDRDSVATTASVVREAIVLMSVHEERANVGRSIQAETAEASSLLLFSTNLSDKGSCQPGCHGAPV